MKKVGKVLGILGGILLFYLSISFVPFIFADVLYIIVGVLGLAGAVAAVIGNAFVEGKRLKPILLIGAPCASLVVSGAIIIPSLITGSIKAANELTFVIFGIMLLTCVLLALSAVFGLNKKAA